jgi:hypothetical protein
MALCGFFPLPIDVTSRKGVHHRVIVELGVACEDQQPRDSTPPGRGTLKSLRTLPAIGLHAIQHLDKS